MNGVPNGNHPSQNSMDELSSSDGPGPPDSHALNESRKARFKVPEFSD